MTKKKAVLAYSGGLDTSVILAWLLNEKGWDVVTYTADVGQDGLELEAVRKKALATGASDAVVEDLKEEFVTDYVFPAIRGNAKYEGRYLLGTSLARPLTAKKQVELAKKVGAEVLSHGATGKGNDQVRFELAYHTLFPGCEIYAPWKDPAFLEKFSGRDQLIEFAEAHSIPISQSKKDPWSSDDNLLHISYEAGMLENPATQPLERMFKMTVSPQNAPDKETILEIEFNCGNPISVINLNTGERYTAPLTLFTYLNKVAGENGVGRVDMVENRFVGMKSRGVYETPAGTVLHAAHRDLEGITIDREVMRIRDTLIPTFAERIYSGFWFSPEMDLLRKTMDATQEKVTGNVTVSLYKGNVDVIGRSSPCSLYDEGIASMHAAGSYDQTDAKGFIKINALRLQVAAKRDKKNI
jgi:argininosuccinate synthase